MNQPTPDAAATPIDPEDRLRALEHLRAGQRLMPAVLAGALAALVGAAVWALVVVFTNHLIGWLAIGIGALVGVGVRWQGRGFEVRFAVLGAFLALTGLCVGNVLTVIGLASQHYHVPFFELLAKFPLAKIPSIWAESFQPMDLVFYALAIWCGWKYSRRVVEESEVRATLVEMKSGR